MLEAVSSVMAYAVYGFLAQLVIIKSKLHSTLTLINLSMPLGGNQDWNKLQLGIK